MYYHDRFVNPLSGDVPMRTCGDESETICDDCPYGLEYPDCDRDPLDCQGEADEESAEERYEGLREMYD